MTFECMIGNIPFSVRESETDTVVITACGQTRLRTYECENEDEMRKAFNSIRDTLRDVAAISSTSV